MAQELFDFDNPYRVVCCRCRVPCIIQLSSAAAVIWRPVSYVIYSNPEQAKTLAEQARCAFA